MQKTCQIYKSLIYRSIEITYYPYDTIVWLKNIYVTLIYKAITLFFLFLIFLKINFTIFQVYIIMNKNKHLLKGK